MPSSRDLREEGMLRRGRKEEERMAVRFYMLGSRLLSDNRGVFYLLYAA
jgi:hypothetical protein